MKICIFEIPNGFSGVQRSVAIKLSNLLWKEPDKIRAVFFLFQHSTVSLKIIGMCGEHFKWKSHSCFINNRPVSFNCFSFSIYVWRIACCSQNRIWKIVVRDQTMHKNDCRSMPSYLRKLLYWEKPFISEDIFIVLLLLHVLLSSV
jgi:hypothetical protein